MRFLSAGTAVVAVLLLGVVAPRSLVAHQEESTDEPTRQEAQTEDLLEPGEVRPEDGEVVTGQENFEMFPDEAPDLSDQELRAVGDDPCELNEEGNFVDWLNRTVTKSVCGSARWFDSFFGTQREFEDRDSTFGRLGVGAFWDEDDGIDPEFRFRAKFSLPNANNRWQAAFGHGSVEEVLDGEENTSPADEFFDDESEWLIGFNYNFTMGDRSRLSPSIGASFSSGVDPYVRLRYIYQLPFNDSRSQFRLRIVPQWQESKGYGYQFRTSVDHTLAAKYMLRWDVSIKDFQERFEGFSYGIYLNLFQKLNRRNALRYKIGLLSQSRLEHQPQDFGGGIQWRTTVYKEILIIESTVGTIFRRRPGEEEREPKLILGLVFEIKFGR